jgi:AcrR family transcriptional regulator
MSRAAPARTPRGLARRSQLVRAAQAIFERNGFLEARIADITAEASTATGSFYTYFQSKEEIFLAVVDALDHEGLHPPSLEFLTTPGGDTLADIAEHHRDYLRAFHANAKMMSVIEEVTNVSEEFQRERTARAQVYISGNVAAIRALQADGRADPALDALTTGRALSVMVSRAAYVTFVLEQEPADAIDGLAETLARLWVNALRIP